MTSSLESVALAALAAITGPVFAAAWSAQVGGLPFPHEQMLTAVGLFAVVSMITAIGVAAARRQGVWGAGKTVLNGVSWGAVAAAFCELRGVDRSITLLACAGIGMLGEVFVSRLYTWSRTVELTTVGGFVRNLVLAALRLPIPPPAAPPQPRPPAEEPEP